MKLMRHPLVLVAALLIVFLFCPAALPTSPDERPKPQYDEKGNLLRPTDYRDWEYLSAGYGMNYSPAPGSHELFTNVFVPRRAYQALRRPGKQQRPTMFGLAGSDSRLR